VRAAGYARAIGLEFSPKDNDVPAAIAAVLALEERK